MINSQLAAELEEAKVIAVVTIEDPARAVSLAKALVAGGVRAIELTLRTPRALEAIKAITASSVELMVGAGTVLTREQLNQVRDAGAALAVAPGFNPDIVQAADDMGFPFAPGVMTPSEIEGAVAMGNTILKFYHAGVAGGHSAFKSMVGPYNHLGLRYIPLGGVNTENLREWSSDPAIIAVGGSWIAPPGLIADGEWAEITSRAREAISIAKGKG